MSPFHELLDSNAFSERALAKYCHLVLASQDKKELLTLVCEAGEESNAVHAHTLVVEARDYGHGWRNFQQLAKSYLYFSGI